MFNPKLELPQPPMAAFLERHREWSWSTFGTPKQREDQWNALRSSTVYPQGGKVPIFSPVSGVIEHIRKELVEIEKNPTDIPEWFDVLHLACDGYLRAGGTIQEFMVGLFAKQRVNFNRRWPDWTKTEPGRATEHERGYQD